jgi:hypothetical protein
VPGLVFTGHRGYALRADFVVGFVPATWFGPGLLPSACWPLSPCRAPRSAA